MNISTIPHTNLNESSEHSDLNSTTILHPDAIPLNILLHTSSKTRIVSPNLGYVEKITSAKLQITEFFKTHYLRLQLLTDDLSHLIDINKQYKVELITNKRNMENMIKMIISSEKSKLQLIRREISMTRNEKRNRFLKDNEQIL